MKTVPLPQKLFSIPLVDLQAQYVSIQEEVDTAIKGVFERGDYILGQSVELFEKEFADYCQSRFAIGVASGLDAIALSLKALGIGPGDEVITAANTFVATTLAIIQTGARPVLVDCEPDSFTMDWRQIESKITSRTRAILPVHLYGQCAEMDPLMAIAQKHGLFVVEDACQAHGAEYKGWRAGSFGIAGCFSFYPGKNLGAYGDGGCVVTSDPALAERLRMLRNVGSTVKYHHELQGTNSRLDTLQAAVLRVKLRHLDGWNRRRNEGAKHYSRWLEHYCPEAILPTTRDGRAHVYHLYVIQIKNRDALLKSLAELGIAAGIHYPVPIHLQKCHQDLGYHAGDFPVSERLAKRLLSLPLYPELSETQIQQVAETLKKIMGALGALRI